MRDVRYWIGFNRVNGIGAAKVRALIDHFGDLEHAWSATPIDLKEAGLDRRAIDSFVQTRSTIQLDREVERVEKIGAKIIIWDDPDYPPLLRNIPDAPPMMSLSKEAYVSFSQPVRPIPPGTESISAMM